MDLVNCNISYSHRLLKSGVFPRILYVNELNRLSVCVEREIKERLHNYCCNWNTTILSVCLLSCLSRSTILKHGLWHNSAFMANLYRHRRYERTCRLHVKCLIILSSLKQIWRFSTNCRESPQYHISRTFVQ
jgi:hypothetical protein